MCERGNTEFSMMQLAYLFRGFNRLFYKTSIPVLLRRGAVVMYPICKRVIAGSTWWPSCVVLWCYALGQGTLPACALSTQEKWVVVSHRGGCCKRLVPRAIIGSRDCISLLREFKVFSK